MIKSKLIRGALYLVAWGLLEKVLWMTIPFYFGTYFQASLSLIIVSCVMFGLALKERRADTELREKYYDESDGGDFGALMKKALGYVEFRTEVIIAFLMIALGFIYFYFGGGWEMVITVPIVITAVGSVVGTVLFAVGDAAAWAMVCRAWGEDIVKEAEKAVEEAAEAEKAAAEADAEKARAEAKAAARRKMLDGE